MKKSLLLAALALCGAAAQANAADIVAGKVYTVKYVGANADAANPLYLNLAKPAEKVDGGTSDHNAGLSSTPCPITFVKNSNNNSYLIRAAEQFGYLNLDSWNACIGSINTHYWFMNSVAAEGSEELKFTIEKTANTATTNRFLAANKYADNQPLYTDKTEAAAWLLEPYTPTYSSYVAPETSTAENPKYYRIVSSRAASNIYKDTFHGKYMQIDGETGTAASLNQQTHIGNDRFGAYWWFEATGEDGAVIIHNLVSDYALKANGTNAVTMSEAGTPFFLINVTGQTATGGTNTIMIPNTFAISTANIATGHTCLDQSNNGGDAKVCWSPLDGEDKGDGDNGSAWYFELATADEVSNATSSYIAAVKANYPKIVNAGKTSVLGTLNALSGIMDTEAAIAAVNAFGPEELTATTIAEANAALTATRAAGLPESALSDEVRATMASSLVGKFIQLKSRVTSAAGHNHPYVTVNEALDGTDLNNNISNDPIRAIWEIVASDTEGKVCLRNVHANKFLKLNAEYNVNNPISEESGDAFTIRFSTERNGFGFDAGNSLNGEYLALHAAVQNGAGKTLKWDLSENNSWFDLVAVDGQVNVATTKGDAEGEVVLNFGEGVTPTAGAAYQSESHKLIVTPVSPAERSVAVGTQINAADITDGSVTITGLTQGEYTVTAPAGFFTVDGKLSAPINQSFTVDADGTPTGLDEIGVAVSGKQVIYDLQGRRVQRASKGLYIINGVKTLVK